jgi:hypothetical protein
VKAPRTRLRDRLAVPALVAAVALALLAGAIAERGSGPGDGPAVAAAARWDRAPGTSGSIATGPAVVRNATIRGRVRVVPSGRAIRRAWRFARRSPGIVSVAVIDSVGRLRELQGRRPFVSASVSKAFMLAAYLRRLDAAGASLDSGAAATLRSMITVSDNNAADAIYSSLGDEPIEAAARAAGADTVDVRGYWSETYLSAEDGARFMRRIRAVVPRRFRRFAMGLLAGITAEQRWGIPEAAKNRWRVWFKGGWRTTGLGALTHQAALLRRGHRRMAIAVLTDGMPSMSSGTETIEGIARRLIPRRDTSR